MDGRHFVQPSRRFRKALDRRCAIARVVARADRILSPVRRRRHTADAEPRGYQAHADHRQRTSLPGSCIVLRNTRKLIAKILDRFPNLRARVWLRLPPENLKSPSQSAIACACPQAVLPMRECPIRPRGDDRYLILLEIIHGSTQAPAHARLPPSSGARWFVRSIDNGSIPSRKPSGDPARRHRNKSRQAIAAGDDLFDGQLVGLHRAGGFGAPVPCAGDVVVKTHSTYSTPDRS